MIVFLPIEEVRVGDGALLKSRGSGIDSHEFVGVWKWQRVQEHAVDYKALFAPMPSARVRTATAVNPGFFRSTRSP